MNLLFLGTGAADRMALEQEKDFCDKDKRRCAAAIIDHKILLDCGPHILNALGVANINLSEITDICITHFHADHFDIDAVKAIANASKQPINIWYRDDASLSQIDNCILRPMEPFKEYTVAGYKITGLHANHEAFPQHLSIEKDSKSLFYGMDGAWLLGDTIRYMQNRHYSAIVLDATVGDYSGDYRMGEHNSIPMIRLMTASMKTLNIIDNKTQVFLSHIAVCLHKTFEETEKLVKADAYIVAYDGLEISI